MKSKENTHYAFGVLTFVAAAVSIFIYARMNSAAERQASVDQYAAAFGGRVTEANPDKSFAIPLLLIFAAVIGGLVFWWVHELRQIDKHNANIPDADYLDALFSADREVVSYQVGKGTMSHATVVVAAKERGYALTSQGEDGSLVFEPAN